MPSQGSNQIGVSPGAEVLGLKGHPDLTLPLTSLPNLLLECRCVGTFGEGRIFGQEISEGCGVSQMNTLLKLATKQASGLGSRCLWRSLQSPGQPPNKDTRYHRLIATKGARTLSRSSRLQHNTVSQLVPVAHHRETVIAMAVAIQKMTVGSGVIGK